MLYLSSNNKNSYSLLKTGIVLCIVVFFSSISSLYSDNSKPSNIKSKIVYGMDNNYPPYEYIDGNGQPAGCTIEILKEIASEMKFELEIKHGVWSQIRQWFDSNKVDIISIFFSEERAAHYSFSLPHAVVSYGIFYRKNSPEPDSEADFAGKYILTQRDDIMHEYLMSKGEKLVGVDSPREAIFQLAEGKYDYAVVSRSVGLFYMKMMNIQNLGFKSFDFFNQRYCFATNNKNQDLVPLLNEGLLVLKQSGKYNQIVENELGSLEHVPVTFWDVLEYILYVLVPVAFVAFLLIFWNWQLRNQVKKRTSELKQELEIGKKTKSCSRHSIKLAKVQKHLTT